MAVSSQIDRDYIKILQRRLELACQKLSDEDREKVEAEAASAFEQPLGTSSSVGDTLGTSSGAPSSPDHRPLRGGHVDDIDLGHTTEGGYHIVPHLHKK